MNKNKQKLFASIVASFIVVCLLAQTIAPLFSGLSNKKKTASESSSVESAYNVNSIKDVTDIINTGFINDQVLTADIEEDTIDSDEEVWIIVKSSEESLLNQYLSKKPNMDLSTYVSLDENVAYQEALVIKQQSIYDQISKYCLSDVKFNYTTILNGFAVLCRYGDVDKIEAMKCVDSVIISERYYPQTTTSSGDDVTINDVNVYSTGIYNSSNVSYNGTGTIVAILDTGLDYTHSAFQTMPTGEVAYTQDEISQIVSTTTAYQLSYNKNGSEITGNDVYVSAKVPFAYDYADLDANVYPVNDHGTHVAGIIAGQDETITGVATNAQLAIMKVFSDKDQGANTTDILMALSDCILLNVDVINMSLGTSCGFARNDDEEEVNTIYDGILAAGISLIVAASNDYSAAQGSANGDTNLTSNPDSGTVGSPSTYTASMSVASISGVMTPYFKLGDTPIYFTESSDTTGEQNHFNDELLGNKSELSLNYEVIPGTGSTSDYIGIDVKGKVAIVKRGVITFEEKILTAQAKGAIAVIIYNNQSGTISMSVGNKTEIPSCSISMDMGALFEAQTSGTLYFSKSNQAGPFMSGFSSWGVSPDLELKPDITAHGGDILSAVRGGYDRFSGTSMAAPNMAGATTLVRQYVKEKYPNLTNVEISELVYQLMMSTATIANNEFGNPYSPRKQGAGIADILKATTTEAYLWVEGSNKTKLSLGDDPTKSGVYNLVFNLTNISNKAQSYELTPVVFTETVSSDGETVAEKAYLFNDYNYTVSVNGAEYNNGHVIIKGYDSATITVTITLSDADKAYLDSNFANGMYVEGFVKLTNDTAGGVDLNIPYVAFYGDWTVAPILDVTAYEVAESEADSAVLEKDKLKADAYATIPFGKFTYKSGSELVEAAWGLGSYGYNILDTYTKPLDNEDKAAITEDEEGLFQLRYIGAGLIRGAKKTEMYIVDAATGEIVYEKTSYDGRKSHYSGGRTPGYIDVDFGAAEYGLKNNTKYTFYMTCYLDWDGDQSNNLKNTFSFSFYVDSEKPVMDQEQTKVRIKEDIKGNKTYYLDMYVYDNHYLQCYTIGTYTIMNADGSFEDYESLIEKTIPIDGARGVMNKVTLDITKYWEDIKKNGQSLSVTFIDYARNQSSYTFDLPDTDATEITFAQSTYTLRQYDAYDLFKIITMTPDDSFKHLVSFTSSDETIVRVKDGEIYGVAQGEATITATTESGAMATIKVVVDGKKSSQPTLESLDIGNASVSVEQGEEYTVTAKCEPWYYDASNVEVSWRSTNSKIATVTVDPTDPFTVTIKALSSGTCSIVCQSGKYITSKITFTVKEEFVVESRMLKEYNGRGDENGVVTIPDDKGIIYIYQYAFMNNDYIKKIIVPEGVTTIYSAAIYGCDNLEEVILPESMETIKEFGMAWNPKLHTVELGGTKTIFKYGFIYDTALKNIDLSKVNNIGQSAFYNCSSLESIDISSCGGLTSYAFAYCSGLKEIKMSENTQLLGEYAFSNCTGLTSLTIPSNYVAARTFASCSGLVDVVFTNDVTTIGSYAFASCSKLSNVTYLKTVNTIGEGAFAYCTSLKDVYLPAGLEVLDDTAFGVCSKVTSVTVSKDALLTSINRAVFGDCNKLASFTVEPGNKYLSSANGVLFDKSGKTLILMPNALEETSYTVPSTVRTIGSYAFSYSKLETINLSNVVTLKEGAFYHCTALKNITGTDSLEEIGAYAFYEATALEGIEIGTNVKRIGAYAFANISNEDATYALTIPASVEELGVGAFANNTSINSIVLTTGYKYTTLPDYLFAGDTNVKKIVIPAGVTTVGSYVFSGMTSLTNVTFAKTITEIGTHNFYGDTALTFAYLPQNITYVPAYTFFGCTAITSYKATTNIVAINEYAFANSSVSSVDFGNVTKVGAYAFAATPLVNAGSAKVEKLGEGAFYGCTNLVKVTFANLTKVESATFAGAQSLTDVSLAKAEVIGEAAFYYCTSLTTITLPEAKEIGQRAFLQSGLTTVTLPVVEVIGKYAFAITSIETFNVSATVKKLEETAFAYTSVLKSITVDQNNQIFFTDGGVLYRHLANGKNELITYPTAKDATEYTVVANTVRVAAYAFAGNKTLTQVELPNTLTQVGDACFYDTKITTYIFHSYKAPNLESSFSTTATYETYYMNYVVSIKEADEVELTMYVPSNGSGYTDYVYATYFTNMNVTEEISPDEDTLYLKDLIAKISDNVTLADADVVDEAYSIYKVLNKTMISLLTEAEKTKLENAKKTIDALRG